MAWRILNVFSKRVYLVNFYLLIFAFGFCHVWTSNDIYDYESGIANISWTVLGSSASLPCNTKAPKNDSVRIVLWYHQTKSLPVYSFDHRNESKHWADDRTLGTRASFQFNENGDISVFTLKSVKESDQGVYRCRVDFKSSPTRNYNVNLTIIVPPNKLTLIDDKGTEVLHSMIGPYQEGSTVTVACIASGGWPPAKVTWWKENALLESTAEQLAKGSVRSVLKLKKITRSHLNTVYTCQAGNNNVSAPLSTTVTINMILQPLWVKLQGNNQPMSAGREYELTCQVYGAHPSPVITWWKGNTKLKNLEKSDRNDGNSTISRLNFIPEAQDDGRMLVCRAESSLPSTSPYQDSWKLNVTYKPNVLLEIGKNLNSSAIVEGMDVYFECKIKSNLPVQRVLWKLNGITLNNSRNAGPLITNQTLVLQKVSRENSGLYSCVATNSEGNGESNSFYLDVKYTPICYPIQTAEYGVGRGEEVSVTCQVEANPPNVEFTWKFNNTSSSTKLSGEQISTDGTRSTAAFTPVTEFDFGILYCWAENSLGFQKNPCVYKIIPAGKPDSVSNCSLINQTSNTLSIKCNGGFDGGLKQKFVVEVYEAQSIKLAANLSGDTPEFVVTGLQPSLSYDIVLYAFNSKGRSSTSEFTKYTLRKPSDQMGSSFFKSRLPSFLELRPLLTILFGLAGVFISLACCIVIVIKSQHRKRRKKHFSYKSKESLEKNPDIIPNKDDGCTIEAVQFNDEKPKSSNKETDISLILQNSYGTDMSDFTLHHEDCKQNKMYKKKTSSLRKLNDIEITYAACDQPCPPFVTQETPLLTSNKVPFLAEGQNSVRCCIHGLSRSTSISRF